MTAKSYGLSPRAPPFRLVAGAGVWPSTRCIGWWRKSCRLATPTITGAKASGIDRSVALARWRSPETSYCRISVWNARSTWRAAPLNSRVRRPRPIASHLKPLFRSPRHNRVDVLLGGTEALAELFGRKPFLEVRGCGIVLIGQQLFERRLLFRAAGELHLDALHGQVPGGASEVAARAREGVSGLAQAGKARAIDALGDARPWLGREDTCEGKNQ